MILDKLRLPLLACAFCLAAVFGAGAAEVYPGCAVPPATFHHVWYIDPVNGKTQAEGGLGAQAAPWNSLQAAFSVVPGYKAPLLSTAPYPGGGPIQPGDEILLMSGSYGDVSVGSRSAGVNNPSFVTIAAASGQTPVLSTLETTASSYFVFSGIKVQSLATSSRARALVLVGDRGAALPSSNMVFTNLLVSSADSTSGWTQAQWLAQAREGGIYVHGSDNGANTSCVSVTNSHMTNVIFGANVMGNLMLFSGNEIDHFGDDGIDYAASDVLIAKNFVHDDLNLGNGAHMDGMQGYPGRPVAPATYVTFRNVVIDSDRIIRQTDPNLPFPTYLQAIDAFDGDWENLRVTNNAIVTSSCWGIGFGSVHDGQIINNTVLSDELLPEPGNCKPFVTVVDKTHEGASSNDVVIRNNLTNGLSITSLAANSTMDHNICVTIGGACGITGFADGKPGTGVFKPGVYGDHNIIDGGGAAGEFVTFDPAKSAYDLRLKNGARAIGAGSPDGAPAVDITGAARGHPVDVGAYRYDPGQ